MQLFPWADDVLPLVTALDCWIYPGIAGAGFLGGTFTRCLWYSGFIFIADDSTTVLSDCTFEGAQIVTTVAPISVLLDRAMGDFTLEGLTSGTVEFNMLGGSVMIDSSCIGTGIVKIWGNCKLINNAGAGTTVIDDRNPECKATMVEVLNYAPGVKDSGQLAIDQAVSNITATSFPATADFSVVMTSFDKPTGSGAKYYVQDLFGTRVQVAGIVLGGGATALTLQISVDDPTGLVAANILETIPMTADTVTPLNINLATYPTIFPWLNDGLPHQYDFFFKVDAGNAYFTTLEYWYSTGATGNPWPAPSTFHLDYIGRVCWPNNGPQVSSVEGNPGGFYLCQMQGIINNWPAGNPMMDVLCFNPFLVQDGSSATDLVYYTQIYVLMVGGAH